MKNTYTPLHNNVILEHIQTADKYVMSNGEELYIDISYDLYNHTNQDAIIMYPPKKLTGKFYILKSISLPVGVTLLHDFSFDNGTNQFGLYIKLTKTASETPSVDVILK